jgi:uncharacterized protein YlxW (UPF0749 family)
MHLKFETVLTILALFLTAVSMVLVNRNARRATSVQAENRDLARIRDLRAELTDTRKELDQCHEAVADLNRKLKVSNRDAETAWIELLALKRMAHRPDMTLTRLREYIGPLQDSGEILK